MMTLKAARVNKGLTQKQAAKLIDVSVSALAKWEKGQTCPSNRHVPKILEAYEVGYDELIFLPDDYTLSGKDKPTS